MSTYQTDELDGMSYLAADRSVPLLSVTVGQLLEQIAAQNPHRTALVATGHDGVDVRLTYAELLDEARHVAAGLASLAAPGQFVALWAPNVAEWPIIQYGAAIAGVVLVALNPVLRPAELNYAIGHSRCTVLLHADRSRDYDMAAVAAQLTEVFPELQIVSLSDRARWRADEVPDSLADRVPVDPASAVMLQYTSGTTGDPKGVLLRHTSLVNVSRLTMHALDIPLGAVGVNQLPMFHAASCVIGTIGTMCVGGTEVLIEQFVPGPVLEVMRRKHADVLYYVPAVLGALLEAQRTCDLPAPQLTTILGGGANVPSAMIENSEKVFGSSVYNLFGQTELAPVLSLTRPSDSREDQLSTVGRPLPQLDVKITDPATGVVVPVGEPGEICARGFNQFIGYLHDLEATARAVDEEGFVHTGDIGRLDARGFLSVTGRLKELIIRGGENIAPAEIDSALARSDDILAVAVIGLQDERLGEIVVAVISPRTDDLEDLPHRLQAHLRPILSPHKIPGRWFRTAEFPVTATGKIRKFELIEQTRTGAIEELL